MSNEGVLLVETVQNVGGRLSNTAAATDMARRQAMRRLRQ